MEKNSRILKKIRTTTTTLENAHTTKGNDDEDEDDGGEANWLRVSVQDGSLLARPK